MSDNEKVVVALLGSTGRVGGWVLEGLLEKGYNVRVLVRTAGKLDSYASKPNLTILTGSSSEEMDLKELIRGCDIILCCLGSPNKQTLVMTPSAEALVSVIRVGKEQARLRVVWISSEGVNDGVPQARKYGCSDSFLPSCNICGWGFVGCMQYLMIIPCIIGQNLWDDMAAAEDIFTAEQDIRKRTVIVRPTIMYPTSEHPAFSEEWREEGGDNVAYVVKKPTDSPPGIFINRKSIAKFFLDAVESDEWDGTAVHLFQG